MSVNFHVTNKIFFSVLKASTPLFIASRPKSLLYNFRIHRTVASESINFISHCFPDLTAKVFERHERVPQKIRGTYEMIEDDARDARKLIAVGPLGNYLSLSSSHVTRFQRRTRVSYTRRGGKERGPDWRAESGGLLPELLTRIGRCSKLETRDKDFSGRSRVGQPGPMRNTSLLAVA